MSGTVKGGGPWMRRAIAEFGHQYPDELAALEEAIPDGHHIDLFCGRYPRPLGANLVGPATLPDRRVARVEPGYPTVMAACYAVLAKAREIVVERTEGYVVTAEVA